MAVKAGRRRQPRVVVTATRTDAHTWNLVFLELFLAELGYEVTNLGPCVREDVVVRACRDHRPDLVVVSSVNGHGLRDGVHCIEAIRRCPDLSHLLVVIGGKLDVVPLSEQGKNELLAAGYDAVFPDVDPDGGFRAFLHELGLGIAS
jgi:methylaspartate mutase sigma subunit